jgi:hypothetical protein
VESLTGTDDAPSAERSRAVSRGSQDQPSRAASGTWGRRICAHEQATTVRTTQATPPTPNLKCARFRLLRRNRQHLPLVLAQRMIIPYQRSGTRQLLTASAPIRTPSTGRPTRAPQIHVGLIIKTAARSEIRAGHNLMHRILRDSPSATPAETCARAARREPSPSPSPSSPPPPSQSRSLPTTFPPPLNTSIVTSSPHSITSCVRN